MEAIKTEHLTFNYNPDAPETKNAIEDVNVTIQKGEFIGVIGHTGSGKSTFIQHLNGLLRHQSGKVFIDGEDMWEKPKEIKRFRAKVGLVFQYPEYQLFEETVAADIAYGPKNMGLDSDEVNSRVQQAMQFTGLSRELEGVSPFDLSGGQKRRVAIAGVMAMNPEILVLDEPTAGLDPAGRDQILGEISRYHAMQGNTVILVSHSMEDVAKYADRVLVFDGGKPVQFDVPQKVFCHAEQLSKIGLALPQVTNIMAMLAKDGVPVTTDVFEPEQAAKILLEKLRDNKC